MPVLEDEGFPIGPFAPRLTGSLGIVRGRIGATGIVRGRIGAINYTATADYTVNSNSSYCAMVWYYGTVVHVIAGDVIFSNVFVDFPAKTNPVICINHLD